MKIHQICIFCKNDSSENTSIEHIIPESMGCPDNFYLPRGSVCSKCNNETLSQLDNALKRFFGLLVPWYILANKKGNPATFKSSNIFAENKAGDLQIHLNIKGKPVQIKEGIRLKSLSQNQGVINNIIWQDIDGIAAKINFKQKFDMNKSVKRALHKIAFEYLCFLKGKEYVMSCEFDCVRHFVIEGVGEREILMGEKYQVGDKDGLHQFKSFWGNLFLPFVLFNISFVVSLKDSCSELKIINDKTKELGGPILNMI